MDIKDVLGCYEGNSKVFDSLKTMYGQQRVIPFIGAGLSAAHYPLWRKCLLTMARPYGMQDEVEDLLDRGLFEEAASLIEAEYIPNAFRSELSSLYDPHLLSRVTFAEPLTLLPRLWNSGVITTNFDKVLEKVYEEQNCSFLRTAVPKTPHDTPGISGDLQQGHHVLYKIHGCITNPQNLVFTEKAYLDSYGDPLNLNLPLPKALHQACLGKVLLFMGCSLEDDRTLKILENLSATPLKHLALMELPKETDNRRNPLRPRLYDKSSRKEKEELRRKRKKLAGHNIYCLWYPHGRHEAIPLILRELLPLSSVPAGELMGPYLKREITAKITAHQKRLLNDLLLPWLPKESPGFNFLFKDLFRPPQLRLSKTRTETTMRKFLSANRKFDKNLAVLGDAGSGKSTFLKYIYLYAASSTLCFYINAVSLLADKPTGLEEIISRLIDGAEDCREKILLILDGVDEAFAHNIILFKQMAEKICANDRITLWIGCRSEFFYHWLDPLASNLFFDFVTIKAWTDPQAGNFVKKYSQKTKNPGLSASYANLVGKNLTLKPFTENPFKLSLLLFLLEEKRARGEELDLHNTYSLHNEFYKHWLIREQTRKTSEKNLNQTLAVHYKFALQLYNGRPIELDLARIEKDSAVTGLLHMDKTLGSKAVIKGFCHQSLLEFVLAKKMIRSFEQGGKELITGLTHLYLNDVTDFIKDAFRLMPLETLNSMKNNLEQLYRQIHGMDTVILPEKEFLLLKKLNPYQLFTLKDQIIYFLSRMPGIQAADFIRYANGVETDNILKLNIAYAAALVGPPEIALDYARRIKPGSPEDETNRSWTLVFYGDVMADAYSYQDNGRVGWKKARMSRLRRLQSEEKKALRFRMFDLPLLYTFLVSRGWQEISEEELEIIRNCRVWSEELPAYVSEFLEKAKGELVEAYEENLRKG